MPSQLSVTQWIDRLQARDPLAVQKLWESYFPRLVGLARVKLRGTCCRAADEEDVALSAFASFCRGAEQGHFPDLHDHDHLWRLLVTITVRKARQLARGAGRLKRGGGRVYDEAALRSPGRDGGRGSALDGVTDREPTPELAAQAAEECRRLLDRLGDAGLRAIALWKLEGDTNAVIAARLGCALSTVERRLRLIRQTWETEASP